MATLGIERWGQRAGSLATLMNKHPDAVSRWVSRGAALRSEDPESAQTIDDLDVRLSQRALEEVSKGTRLME